MMGRVVGLGEQGWLARWAGLAGTEGRVGGRIGGHGVAGWRAAGMAGWEGRQDWAGTGRVVG